MRTLYPIARAIMNQNNDTDASTAWKNAVIRERKLLGAKGACAHAAEIIGRDLAYTFSTSNVERLLLGLINSWLTSKNISMVFCQFQWYFQNKHMH